MALLRGNLHTHTSLSDGQHPVEEVLALYRDLGYDFLAITDHDDRISADYWSRLPARAGGMIVLPGVEIDYRPLSEPTGRVFGGGQHIGKIFGEGEELYILNHPGRYGLSATEAWLRVEALRNAGLPIHAVEVTDGGVYRPEYDVPDLPAPKVATDDSHRSADIGRAWIEVDAPRTPGGLVRAIKAGDFRMGFRPAPPAVRGGSSPDGSDPR
jgi:hypothetical protein